MSRPGASVLIESSAMKNGHRHLWFIILILGVICDATVSCPAQAGAPYQPSQSITGTIRIWGDEYMSGVTSAWQKGFQKYHPQISFETKLMGSATAMPGIYTG